MGRGSPKKLTPPQRLLEDSYNEALTQPEGDPDCRETGLCLPGLEKAFGKAKQHHRGGAARCPGQESGGGLRLPALFFHAFSRHSDLCGEQTAVSR